MDITISVDASANRKVWDKYSEEYQQNHGSQLSKLGSSWGVWSIPESELNVLGPVKGKKILELGCGAAQWSIALHKQGGILTGIDNSKKQLERAAELLKENNIDFPLVHCSAESTPFEDQTFDIVFCDHGAMSFSPTRPTLFEVNRILKTGGLFVFNVQSPLHEICYDTDKNMVNTSLHRSHFDLKRSVDEENGMVYFPQSHSQWIKNFRRSGFQILDLTEVQAPADAESSYTEYVSHEWARLWPAEDIWKLRKESDASLSS